MPQEYSQLLTALDAVPESWAEAGRRGRRWLQGQRAGSPAFSLKGRTGSPTNEASRLGIAVAIASIRDADHDRVHFEVWFHGQPGDMQSVELRLTPAIGCCK